MADAAEIDTSTKLAMLLASLGSALQGGGNGWQAITNTANNYFSGMGAYAKNAQDQAEKDALLAYHKAQGARLDAQTEMEREKLRRELAADAAWAPPGMTAPGVPPTPGMAAPPAVPTMGPGPSTPGGVYDVPQQYAPFVEAAAKKYGLDPRLLSSTGWNESRWNPNAVAPGDQPAINPATGRRYDGRGLMGWGDNWAAARGFNAADPAASIDQSGAVYKEYMDKYGGNPLLARLAYGWGPGNVDAWLKAGGDPAKIPDGAKIWLPRTAYGIADDNQARAAFPQIASALRPGVQFALGGGAPVAPTASPSGVTPVQFSPQGGPQAPPQSQAGTPDAGPPLVPRPTQVPQEIGQRLQAMVRSGQLTRAQAEAEANKYLDSLWQQQQQNARSAWEFNRSANTTRQMTPDEVKAAGLIEGGVYQRDREGKIVIAQPPRGYQVVENQDGSRSFVDTMRPNAPPIPIPGPAKPTDYKEVDAVRKEIAGTPQVKDLAVVTPIFGSMIKSSQINSKAADLDLIYGLAKVLDPGSVVREGEMDMVKRTGGIFDQIQGWISSVNAGASLPPDVRANIMQIAANRVAEIKGAADAAIKPYHGYAQRRGWNIDDLLPGLPTLPAYDPASIATMPKAQGGPGAQQPKEWPTPPPAAVDKLKANKDRPGERDNFDAVFGKGAADKILGGR